MRAEQDGPADTHDRRCADGCSGGSVFTDRSARLTAIYGLLLEAYGPQHWWPSDGAFETIVGAILTQSTAWPNVERAINRLRAAGCLSNHAILALEEAEVASLVRPSGYFNVKARKLRAFSGMLHDCFDGSLDALLAQPVEQLRACLLSTYGIGPETADDIVLYAAGLPSFVIDAYTRRIFSRLGVTPPLDDYESWRSMFMSNLPRDSALFNEFHALIVHHAKVSCRKRPLCAGCILQSACQRGLLAQASGLERGDGAADESGVPPCDTISDEMSVT